MVAGFGARAPIALPFLLDLGSNAAIKKLLRIFLWTAAILIVLVVGTVAFLLVRPTAINFSWLHEQIDRQLTKALGRDVSIVGDIVLVTGTSPSLQVEQLTIENPSGWGGGGDFAHLEQFRTQIDLRELMRKEIQIDDIVIEGVDLALAVDADGRGNWEGLFGNQVGGDSADAGTPSTEPAPADGGGDAGAAAAEEPEEEGDFEFAFAGLGLLSVSDLSITREEAGEEAVELFRIDQLAGSAPEVGEVALSVRGLALGTEFDGSLSGGTLKDLLDGASDWPLVFEGKVGTSTLKLESGIASADFSAPTIKVALDIPDSRELERFAGPLPVATSVRLRGEVQRDGKHLFRLLVADSKLGESPLGATVELDISEDLPRITGNIDLDFLDADMLALEPPKGDSAAGEQPEPATTETETEQPEAAPADGGDGQNFVIAERDSLLPVTGKFELKIGEIRNLKAGLRDLSLDLAVEQNTGGADVSVEFAEISMSGQLSLTRDGEGEVALELGLEGKDADLDQLIDLYSGHDKLSGSFERVHFTIGGRGRTDLDAWAKREVQIGVDNARMTFHGGEKDWVFSVEKASLDRGRSTLVANGVLGEAPWAANIALIKRADDDNVKIIDSLEGNVADLKFTLKNNGVATDDGGVGLAFTLAGERLDSLNPIYELDLPPLGPYSVEGELMHTAGSSALEELAIEVGQTKVNGSLRISHGEEKTPKVELALNAPVLQFNDFRFDDWSAVDGGAKGDDGEAGAEAEEEAEEGAGAGGADAVAGEDSDEGGGAAPAQAKTLLSHETLSSLDGTVDLRIGKLYSGSHDLGAAKAEVELQDGRFELKQLTATPGGGSGSLTVGVLYHPKANGTLDWRAKMGAKNLDYSIIAQLINPESASGGLINIDMDVAANGVPFGKLNLAQATGQLNFDFCPTKLEAGILDLWATNVLVALLPKVDSEPDSVINCVLGRCQLKDGVLTPETLGLDTTKIRVFTEGVVDIAGNEFDLTMTPFPKRAQLLSIEAPVSIIGPLTKPEISLGRAPIAATFARMTKNTVLFPLKTVAGERIPADGSDICPCKAGYAPPAEGDVPPGAGREDEVAPEGGEEDKPLRRRLRDRIFGDD